MSNRPHPNLTAPLEGDVRPARIASAWLVVVALAIALDGRPGLPWFRAIGLAVALAGLGLTLASMTRGDRARPALAVLPLSLGCLAAIAPLSAWSTPALAGSAGLAGLGFALFLQALALLVLPTEGVRIRHLVAETCAAASIPVAVTVLATDACPAAWLGASVTIGLVASGLGILLLRPRQGHLAWLLNTSPASVAVRRQLFTIVLLLPAVKLIRHTIEGHGWLQPMRGDAFEVALYLFVLGAGAVWSARRRDLAHARLTEAEDVSRKREARFRRLVESDVIGVMGTDASGRLRYANDVLLKMLGFSREELEQGRIAWRELTPPDCRALDDEAQAEMRTDDGSCVPYEKVFLHRDGTRVPVLIGFAWLDGRRDEAIGFVLDNTARKNAEDALQRTAADLERRVEQRTAELAQANARLAQDLAEREVMEGHARASDDRLRAATRSSFDPIVTVDSEARVVFWNPAAQAMFGYDEAEMLGQSIERLVPPGHRAEFDMNLARMRTGQPTPQGARLELRTVRRDGTELDIELTVSDWFNQSEHFYTAIVRDITERKAIEGALTLARDQAELASRYKSAFLANMSHEIRTPMNVLLGMSELLARTALHVDPVRHAEEQARYAKAARQAGEHLIAVIDDVLDFSKVEAGHFVLEEATFEPRDIVEQTVEFFSHRAHQKNLALSAQVDDGVPRRVLGDAHRLRQVLVNLMGNAVKFTEHGGVTVEVHVLPGDVLHVTVADTGIGVPADKHERIFEAFTQVDASMTRKHGGTGLGLAISKRIVERMGGRMWLDSREGHGSVFHFTASLPAQPEVLGTERLPGSVRHRHPSSAPLDELAVPGSQPIDLARDPNLEVEMRLRTGAVLVADANPVHRQAVRQALQRLGARVDEAEDVESALRLLGSGMTYAFVIADAKLPDVGGLGLAQRLRREVSAPWPEVVLARSDEDSLDVSQMQRAGVLVTVRKPVRRTVLADALAAAVQHVPLVQAGATAQARALRILVVDDAEDNRMLVRAFLHDLGWQVDEADNGARALEMWQPGRYDVVLMDVQMPVMDGYTTTREIRRLEREGGWVPMPIVALTAHALPEARAHSLEAGCTAHVTKPVRRGQLVDLVRSLAGPGTASSHASQDPLSRTQETPPWLDDGTTPRDEIPLVAKIDAVLGALVPDFLDHRRRDVLALRQAVVAVDFERVRILGHSMKGSGGSYGFDAITDLGRDIEAAAEARQADQVLVATARLEQYLAKVQVVLA